MKSREVRRRFQPSKSKKGGHGMALPFRAPSWQALEAVVPEACRQAGASLSEFAQDPVEVRESAIEAVPWVELRRWLGPRVGDGGVAVVLAVEGDDRGMVSLLWPGRAGEHLAGLLMGQDTWPLDEIGRSALAEVGNITAAAFLNVVADAFGARLLPSTPRVLDAAATQLLDHVMGAAASLDGENVLVVRTAFRLGRRLIDGYLLVVSTTEQDARDTEALRQA
jgi:chemotaxis protein CheC